MPRKQNARRTLGPADESFAGDGLEKESDDATGTVDILDSELETSFGYAPDDVVVFLDDFEVRRVPVTTDTADEAAATISIAHVTRNGGDDGFTVNFSAAPAATKRCRVRVTPK